MVIAPELEAWLFDLDGVLTDTANLHDAAWQVTFDKFLGARNGDDYVPFDPTTDYERYVDGKPRLDGVRDFLASRGIEIPEGSRSDPPDRITQWGIGNRKNALLLELLEGQGPEVFPGSVALVRRVRTAGARTAVVSASENCGPVLDRAGISGLFDAVVDGKVAARWHLPGKPAPDTYLYAARELSVVPSRAAVVEDAPAGVSSGRAGGFGWVVGVARRATPAELKAAGADTVVHDLAELVDGVAPGSGAPIA